MRSRPNLRRPDGFTIVELLVAMALIVFIMYVLAEAFSAGSSAFRTLKAVGDMNERLRTASTVLRRYLQADHFEGKKRLSDPSFWNDGPPREGFFRVVQYSGPTRNYAGPYVAEGTDPLDGGTNWPGTSFRATNHVLHFTVKLRGNSRGEFFRASVPWLPNPAPNGPSGSPLINLPMPDSRFEDGAKTADGRGVICSPWGEVCLFMVDSGETTKDPQNATGQLKGVIAEQKLHTLCLRQRIVMPDNEQIRTTPVAGGILATQWLNYREVSCFPNPMESAQNRTLYFNSPSDLTMPARRWSGFTNPLTQTPDQLNLLWPTGQGGGVKPEFPYPTFGREETAFAGAPVVLAGTDVLLTDVLSCDIKFLFPDMTDFVDLFHPKAMDYWTGKNTILTDPLPPANPAGFNSTVRVFDTWSQKADDWVSYRDWYDPANSTATAPYIIPMYINTSGQTIRILAIQITLRIWDHRTQQTRQTSIVVDL